MSGWYCGPCDADHNDRATYEAHKAATAPPEPDHLRAVVESVTYRPGWGFRLGTFNHHLALWIITNDVDSYDHTKPMKVTHAFPVPPTLYGRDEWVEWVLDRILDVDRHEAGEFFMVDGVRVFAPRHGPGQNPYRLYRERADRG